LPGPALTWTRPRALRPGDLIGVCAPAGPVAPARLDKGVAELASLGFRVRVSPGSRMHTGFTAGSAAARQEDLEALFRDEEVAGIVCARGGAGAGWLLPRLDAALLREHPKVFVGYSDITFLHLLLNRLEVVSFHGPMVARELADASYDRDSFQWAVTGEGRAYASEADDLLVLRRGTGEGRLRGGCLSVVAGAAGTPWALSTTDDTVLFLEDVDEAPYRIDRMLLQLRESGALAGVRGIVFGDMRGCSPPLAAHYGLEDVIREALDGLDVPIALGLCSGHTHNPCLTLPLGVRARLECGEGARFEVLEAAVG
jgi:muramoyltetrapeptide carboxypeptidase